jgi:hypothetical protein
MRGEATPFRFLVGKPEGKESVECLMLDGRIILK